MTEKQMGGISFPYPSDRIISLLARILFLSAANGIVFQAEDVFVLVWVLEAYLDYKNREVKEVSES